MKLFVSYARVDKPYCIQIVDMLDVHETWYDQRLYAGQNWWKEILRRLEWCDGFIYLLSPESVKSEYCRREFELAQTLGRHIFPVIVHSDVKIPDSLKDIQYADLSKGLTAESVRILLNAIYLASSHNKALNPAAELPATNGNGSHPITADVVKPPTEDSVAMIAQGAQAMQEGNYDQAVFLFRRCVENGYSPKFINVQQLLKNAENALARQTYTREAERDYRPIAALIQYEPTFKLGCEAFSAFRKEYPDYDPDNLGQYCENTSPAITITTTFKLPLLEWCEVPSGSVDFVYTNDNRAPHHQQFEVGTFRMSKYPVTNAQFNAFLEDPYGYANLEWWQYSAAAYQWRKQHAVPFESKFKGDERPREMVTWFDAVAYCQWLTDRMKVRVMLPSVAEWQRAYQGDNGNRYPWGNKFNKNNCNTAESDIKMTTIVTAYEKNVSQFNVCDMAGNVWEWCRNADLNHRFSEDLSLNAKRVVRGGSYMSPANRSEVNFHYALNPSNLHASIGFRLVYHEK